MIRRLVVSLVVLGLLAVGADVGLRLAAERQVGARIQSSLHLASRPAVSLGSFPFLLHVARGDFPEVSVRAEHVQAGGVELRGFVLTLHDVSFSLPRLLAGRGEVRARAAEGAATVSGPALTGALQARGIAIRVRFHGGKVLLTGGQLPEEVPARLSASGRTITVTSLDPRLPGSFPVVLPELVKGLTMTGIEVHGSLATVAFAASGPAVRFKP